MKIKHTSVLFLTLLGATAGFPQVILNPVPARAIGQSILVPESCNPNLVEGRELWSPTGIAFDTSTSPPTIYVADTLNNRVLGWKNAASFANGQMADLVIGQSLDTANTFVVVSGGGGGDGGWCSGDGYADGAATTRVTAATTRVAAICREG